MLSYMGGRPAHRFHYDFGIHLNNQLCGTRLVVMIMMMITMIVGGRTRAWSYHIHGPQTVRRKECMSRAGSNGRAIKYQSMIAHRTDAVNGSTGVALNPDSAVKPHSVMLLPCRDHHLFPTP